MSTQPAMTAIAFGRYQLTDNPARLYMSGKPAAIGSRPLAILRVLLQANGHTVSTDELREKVWYNANVSVNSIQSKVAALRRALGGDEHWVETVRGQGYRFTGECRQTPNHHRFELPRANAISEEATDMPHARTELPLPRGTTPFVGRHAEVSELLALVPTARVVTLTGPYGVGKTRVAFELVRRLAPLFPHGSAMVRCASEQHVGTFASTCVQAWNIETDRGHAPNRQLREWLKSRRLLLLIDDVDVLPVETVQYIGTLIDEATGVSVISTAENTPCLHAEHVVRISALQTPLCGASALTPQCDALQLLFARLHMLTSTQGAAQQRRAPTAAGSMSYSDASPRAISMAARVAALAEGMPLALELAAFAIAQRIRAGESLDTALAMPAGNMRSAAGEPNTRHGSTTMPDATAFLPIIRYCLDPLNALEHATLRSLSAFKHAVTRGTALHRLKSAPRQASISNHEPPPGDAALDACLSRLIDARLVQDIMGAEHTTMLKANEWLSTNADALLRSANEEATTYESN